jgi:hypothetical protein
LIGSTLRKHRAGGVRPRMHAGDLPSGAEKIGRGLFTTASTGGRSYFFGIRGKRVRFVGVAASGVDSAAELRAYVRRAHLDRRA